MDLSAVGNAAQAPKKDTGLAGNEVMSGNFSGKMADNGGVVVNVEMQKLTKENGKDYPSYCPDKVFVFTSLADAASFIGGIQKGQPAPEGGSDHAGASQAPPTASSSRFPAPAPIPSGNDGY